MTDAEMQQILDAHRKRTLWLCKRATARLIGRIN